MGLTIRIPNDRFEQAPEHVLMDDDELGYFIPQRTQVIAGGTNEIVEHDDPVVGGAVHPALVNEWEGVVREKMERLLPGTGDLEGEVRVGPRPMRGRVLTHWTEDFEAPGVILGGAGGSGWTFSVGIAHDVCQKIARHFDCKGNLRALGTLAALDPLLDLDPVV
jgi:glycine/D-amino acid oxidase-like deaminating enzyme